MITASTITGSIGVAALRPNLTERFFDRIKVTTDSYFTGSRSQDLTSPLSTDDLKRYRASIDEMYEDFKGRVMKGRGIVDPIVMESLAGGRVYTGRFG
jgi:ClpP class serine protease